MNNNSNLLAWVSEVRGFPRMLVLATSEPDVYKAVRDSFRIRDREVNASEIDIYRSPGFDVWGRFLEANAVPARVLVHTRDAHVWELP